MAELQTYHSFLTSLVFTIIVETAVVFIMLYMLRGRDIDPKLIIFAGIFVNFATVPYVWFVVPGLLDCSRSTALIVSEPFVFLVEAVFYRIVLKIDMKEALLISLVANSCSYFLGPLLRGVNLWIYW